MTRKNKKITIASEDEVAQYAPEKSEPPVDEAAQAAKDEADSAEAIDWQDRYLRAKADFQNMQRRAEEQRISDLKYANAEFARALLEVVDDFDRTLEAVDGESVHNAFLEGVRLTYHKLLKILKDHQVNEIEALNKAFDPKYHEALMQQVDTDVAQSGT